MDQSRTRVGVPPPAPAGSVELIPDLRPLLTALGPLGDDSPVVERAVRDPVAFERVLDLFLATAPEDSDPVQRLADGLNLALYRLAKAVLAALPASKDTPFTFDRSPEPIERCVAEARDRIDALAEYTEGHSTDPADRHLIEQVAADMTDPESLEFGLVETILRRCIALGGRHGLDAANLLGFLCYQRGDLDQAELLFRAVIDHEPRDGYERETLAHAMNNLTGVFVGRGDPQSAILWCERSLMLKEQLGLDALSNYLNLLFLWMEQGTAYGRERSRHYIRKLLSTGGGQAALEATLARRAYERARRAFVLSGLHKEFPEVRLPAAEPKGVQKTLERETGREES